MRQEILSLNVGVPQTHEWNGKSVETSMIKSPVSELRVHMTSIDGDRFANQNHHGTPDSILYIVGRDACAAYGAALGRPTVDIGEIGETITVAEFDESKVSVGDRFQIGEVVAEATFPRIPCAKLNFILKDPNGQKAMIQSGRSGVYFRIIKPGIIKASDRVERVSEAKVRFTIREVYDRMVGGVKLTKEDLHRAKANGAFPEERLTRWTRAFAD